MYRKPGKSDKVVNKVKQGHWRLNDILSGLGMVSICVRVCVCKFRYTMDSVCPLG